MNISPTAIALIAALSALGGATISSIFNLINAYITKKSEERKHQRELLFKVSIAYWKNEPILLDNDHYQPLEAYVTRMQAFFAGFIDESFDEPKFLRNMDAMNKLNARFREHKESLKTGKPIPPPNKK